MLHGTYETGGDIGIDPDLPGWLGQEPGKEANVSKERRVPRWKLEADFEANKFENEEDAHNPWISKTREERALALASKR